MGTIDRDNSSTHMDSRRPVVAVIGASSAEPVALEIAEGLGRAICRQGWHLLSGGGSGVMEAACRGFIEARQGNGGLTIGILPSEDTAFANRFVELAIPTGIGFARNAIIARAAWALVAVGGCSGTLCEIAFGWQMGRPIVAMADSGGWSEKLAGRAIDSRRKDVIFSAQSAKEAIDYLKPKFDNR